MKQPLVIDSSAFVVILMREPEADDFSACIRSYPQRLLASANHVECSLVLSRWQDSRVELEDWLLREAIAVAPIDHDLARLAADAFIRFGKGRHPAGLNFGDCFAYALATSLSAPLLFKGEDFARTDIVRAV